MEAKHSNLKKKKKIVFSQVWHDFDLRYFVKLVYYGLFIVLSIYNDYC